MKEEEKVLEVTEGTDKRDFLKALGAGLGIAGITSMMGGQAFADVEKKGKARLIGYRLTIDSLRTDLLREAETSSSFGGSSQRRSGQISFEHCTGPANLHFSAPAVQGLSPTNGPVDKPA